TKESDHFEVGISGSGFLYQHSSFLTEHPIDQLADDAFQAAATELAGNRLASRISANGSPADRHGKRRLCHLHRADDTSDSVAQPQPADTDLEGGRKYAHCTAARRSATRPFLVPPRHLPSVGQVCRPYGATMSTQGVARVRSTGSAVVVVEQRKPRSRR